MVRIQKSSNITQWRFTQIDLPALLHGGISLEENRQITPSPAALPFVEVACQGRPRIAGRESGLALIATVRALGSGPKILSLGDDTVAAGGLPPLQERRIMELTDPAARARPLQWLRLYASAVMYEKDAASGLITTTTNTPDDELEHLDELAITLFT